MMQVFVISVQNAVARARIGSATALATFSRQIGATIGVTVMGVVVNHGLPAAAATDQAAPIHRYPEVLRRALAGAITPAFFAATIASLAVWVIAVLFVKEVALRRTVDEVTPVVTAVTPEAGPPR
jgi:hypothetical protein